MPADGFGLLGKPAGEISGWCGHGGSRRRPAVAGGPEVALLFSLLRRDSLGLREDRLIFGRLFGSGHGHFVADARRFLSARLGGELKRAPAIAK
jgi:hypothetical protein